MDAHMGKLSFYLLIAPAMESGKGEVIGMVTYLLLVSTLAHSILAFIMGLHLLVRFIFSYIWAGLAAPTPIILRGFLPTTVHMLHWGDVFPTFCNFSWGKNDCRDEIQP